jgi:hypothetical protein
MTATEMREAAFALRSSRLKSRFVSKRTAVRQNEVQKEGGRGKTTLALEERNQIALPRVVLRRRSTSRPPQPAALRIPILRPLIAPDAVTDLFYAC